MAPVTLMKSPKKQVVQKKTISVCLERTEDNKANRRAIRESLLISLKQSKIMIVLYKFALTGWSLISNSRIDLGASQARNPKEEGNFRNETVNQASDLLSRPGGKNLEGLQPHDARRILENRSSGRAKASVWQRLGPKPEPAFDQANDYYENRDEIAMPFGRAKGTIIKATCEIFGLNFGN